MSVLYCIELRNCKTSLSERMCTSIVLTHCPPQKMFPQGAVVRDVRSTKEPVLAVVHGPSPHGDQYRTIVCKRGATEVVYGRAAIIRLTVVRATSPPPRPTEASVQAAEVLPSKGVGWLQSTLHAAMPAAASLSIPVADGERVQLFDTM